MKKRLDVLLVERGLEQSRERARSLIMEGAVLVDGEPALKAGTQYDEEKADIVLKAKGLSYVSRGGLKLERAMAEFSLNWAGKTAMDIGASTGGFTDCMLQNGVSRVFCVDVGYGQLAWTLRNDARVTVMERTNIRHVTPEQIGLPLGALSIDVSFISLKLVLPVASALLEEGGEAVALIKPQFEAGREQVGKKGVVRKKEVHIEVIERCLQYARDVGLSPLGLTHSPITGPKGNIEFLLFAKKGAQEAPLDAAAAVETAHRVLHEGGNGDGQVGADPQL